MVNSLRIGEIEESGTRKEPVFASLPCRLHLDCLGRSRGVVERVTRFVE